MRGLTWLIVVMLLLSGCGPVGSMIVASMGAAPVEDDDNVESAKPAFQLAQEQQQPRRCSWVRPLAPPSPAAHTISISLRDRKQASMVFPVAGRLRLTC